MQLLRRNIVFKKQIKYLYIGALLFHSFNKFILRPAVLKNESPQFLKVFVLSVPNFLEAVIGVSVLVFLLTLFSKAYINKDIIQNTKYINFLAVLFASVYVITQEFKIHNLGGRNVYDFNDVLASIIGLVFMSFIIQKGVLKFGAIQKTAS